MWDKNIQFHVFVQLDDAVSCRIAIRSSRNDKLRAFARTVTGSHISHRLGSQDPPRFKYLVTDTTYGPEVLKPRLSRKISPAESAGLREGSRSKLKRRVTPLRVRYQPLIRVRQNM